MKNATARPVSTMRNASAWSLAVRIDMPMFFDAFSSVSHLMFVVPAVETTVLPLRSASMLTFDAFLATKRLAVTK